MRKTEKRRKKGSITVRWLYSSLLITFIVLAIAETVFMLYTYNSSYNYVKQAIESRISTIDGRLQSKRDSSSEERELYVKLLMEEFGEKDKFEFMLLNNEGLAVATSSGFKVSETKPEQDYINAVASANGMGETVSSTAAGEKVMSVTYILPFSAGNISAIRLITSLEQVDRRINVMLFISLAIILIMFGISVLSGVFFIRSIVRPLNDVEISADKIAKGDFKTRLHSKNNDEIGRLCDTINHMADELAKTDQLKNEFISSVSHELRTPLTSIKGWVETLDKVDDVNDESYKKGMQIIMRETDRLYGMVEELLDFSRIENKGLRLDMQLLDLIAEVSDVVIMFEARAQSEGINICCEDSDDIIVVNGDANRLKQVFVNIMDNAFKYSPQGGTVSVKIYTDNENAFVKISDCGKGIAEDELEKVKIKFYKGRGSVRGSGIGLAVVDEILKAHGGDFIIESKPGAGTEVTVRLPSATVKKQPAN